MSNTVPEWQKGNPTKAGFYVIATLYDNGMGTIGANYWDTEQGWSVEGNAIGRCTLR